LLRWRETLHAALETIVRTGYAFAQHSGGSGEAFLRRLGTGALPAADRLPPSWEREQRKDMADA
jgi:hypothetical protein